MQLHNLIAILPLSRVDPDPAELTERTAEAVLGGYQVLWHPALLSRSATLPVWVRPAEPPVAAPGQLILIPEAARRFLPASWEDQAQAAGATVIAGEQTRVRFHARIREILPPDLARFGDSVEAEDFLALGLARLWMDMVTAYMRHVSTLDEDHFQKEVLAAASAAVLGDSATCGNHLRVAFETLKEARERLYPADIHLLDFCLVHPQAGFGRITRQLSWGLPVNVFLSGHTAEQLRRAEPAAAEQLRVALDEGHADIVGGEFDEVASTLLPVESHLWQFRRGVRSYRDVLGRAPAVYGRRRFGLARHVFQLLNRMEMYCVAHFSFDEGVFPTPSDAKVRLEAPDSTTIEALARVPMAADKALELLKFPHALARTMSADHVATLPLVHWPMPDAPWYEDLLRITRHAPVFGRFSTLSNYFQTTDPPPISTRSASDDYASPFLVYAHNQTERQPISQYAHHHRLRSQLETTRWLEAIACAIRMASAGPSQELDEIEECVETGNEIVASRLDAAEQRQAWSLAELICKRPGDPAARGTLVFNSLGFARRAVVRAGDAVGPVSVELPAMGFRWISQSPQAVPEAEQSAVTLEGRLIRNEHVEVELDDSTGGVRAVRAVRSGATLLGQQLVLVGTPAGSTRPGGVEPGLDEPVYSAQPCKSQMRAVATTVLNAGPELVEVAVEGELLAIPCPAWASEPRMARFRQTYRLGRGRSVLRIGVEITEIHDGAIDRLASPWQSYLAARFAWPDPRSLLTRALGTVAEPTRAQRPETPYFVEIHGRRQRVAILTGGLPFHQRVGERMLDTLLLTATETGRTFELAIGLDVANPFHAALDLITPPVMIAMTATSPVSGSGWFFHVDSSNVVITSTTPLGPERAGVRMRLFESAGRYTRAKLRSLRDVAQARLTDFHGQRLATLDAQGDTINLDLAPHEFTQLEIEFA
jgi:alpha-mannosidase